MRSSWPSANGSCSGSIGAAGSHRGSPPGRRLRSPATIVRCPESGSMRSSGTASDADRVAPNVAFELGSVRVGALVDVDASARVDEQGHRRKARVGDRGADAAARVVVARVAAPGTSAGTIRPPLSRCRRSRSRRRPLRGRDAPRRCWKAPNSARQGPHQEAHLLITTGVPRSAARRPRSAPRPPGSSCAAEAWSEASCGGEPRRRACIVAGVRRDGSAGARAAELEEPDDQQHGDPGCGGEQGQARRRHAAKPRRWRVRRRRRRALSGIRPPGRAAALRSRPGVLYPGLT